MVKFIALICLTKYILMQEKTHAVYNPHEFKQHTMSEKLALQNAGVKFNHDEVIKIIKLNPV